MRNTTKPLTPKQILAAVLRCERAKCKNCKCTFCNGKSHGLGADTTNHDLTQFITSEQFQNELIGFTLNQ